jgi:hypothetical protein
LQFISARTGAAPAGTTPVVFCIMPTSSRRPCVPLAARNWALSDQSRPDRPENSFLFELPAARFWRTLAGLHVGFMTTRQSISIEPTGPASRYLRFAAGHRSRLLAAHAAETRGRTGDDPFEHEADRVAD